MEQRFESLIENYVTSLKNAGSKLDGLDPNDDAAWAPLRSHWEIREGTVYLNHGSFGLPPASVRGARREWQDELDRQPMDFFVRKLEPALQAARERLARFIGADAGNLIFVENATAGMNIAADSFPLAAGDEVLLTDHEYGAVKRIWQRACDRSGALFRIAPLPLPFRTREETVDALFAEVTDRTRMLVVSHITSPTAVTLPVVEICRRARERGIAVAIDGPHAIVQEPLDLASLDCDYYAASCHKWLSAPFGSGFLYVAPRHQAKVRPPMLSWGRLLPGEILTWADEFVWSGTRDPSAYLSIPAAIDFLEEIGLENFRVRSHALAQYARERVTALTGLEPMVPDDPQWYCAMAHVPLPDARDAAPAPASGCIDKRDKSCPTGNPLQNLLWHEFGIETPVVEFHGRRWARISCHLYNSRQDIDQLVDALGSLLRRGQ